jgi:hypothetical protein
LTDEPPEVILGKDTKRLERIAAPAACTRRSIMQPTPLPLPNARERSYLSAFRIAAICISVQPSGPITLRAVRDLAEAPAVVTTAWWCADLATAEAVADQAAGVDLRGGAARSVDAAAVAIVTAAKRMGAKLSTHESVLARARAATRRIGERVEQAAAAGDHAVFQRVVSTEAQGGGARRAEARLRGVSPAFRDSVGAHRGLPDGG